MDFGTSGEAEYDRSSYSLDEDYAYIQEDFRIWLGTTAIRITFIDGEETPADWEESSIAYLAPTYDVYTVLATEITEDTSWALIDGIYILDYSELMYSEFELEAFGTYHFSIAVYATPDRMIDDLNWVADNMFVDDTSVLMWQDYSHLEPYISGTSDVQPQMITDHVTTVEDWQGEGLESENLWTSPQFGHTISWDASWAFPFASNKSITIDKEEQQDKIVLVRPDKTGEVAIYIRESTEELATPQDWLDRWTSDEWLNNPASKLTRTVIDTVLTDTGAGVLIEAETHYGDPMTMVYTAYIAPDGSTMLSVVHAEPENIGTVYQLYVNGLTLDGQPVPVVWPVEDVQALPAN